jgi:Holliday junction resolvase RusA-like endonuclease
MTSFSVTLAVEPVPKGRPRMGHGHVYTPERTAEFENTVRWLLRQQHVPKLNGDVVIDVTFWVKRRDSDWDNYAKALCDAGNGICWADDKQIADARVRVVKVTAGLMPCIELTASEAELLRRCSAGLAFAAFDAARRVMGGDVRAVTAVTAAGMPSAPQYRRGRVGGRHHGPVRQLRVDKVAAVRGRWFCGRPALTRRHGAPSASCLPSRTPCRRSCGQSGTACRRRIPLAASRSCRSCR